METTVITRTSHGLVDALFSAIDRLNSKEIDSEHARAISHTARSIVNVARLELEYRKFASEGNAAMKITSLALDKDK